MASGSFNSGFSLAGEADRSMTQRVLSRGVVVIVGMGAFGYILGYAARLPLLRGLSTEQQAWAVFAIGLIAATLLLFRASQVSEVAS
jgi:hypothetical protein